MTIIAMCHRRGSICVLKACNRCTCPSGDVTKASLKKSCTDIIFPRTEAIHAYLWSWTVAYIFELWFILFF